MQCLKEKHKTVVANQDIQPSDSQVKAASKVWLHQLVPCLPWSLQSLRGLSGNEELSNLTKWQLGSHWSLQGGSGSAQCPHLWDRCLCKQGETQREQQGPENSISHNCSLPCDTSLVLIRESGSTRVYLQLCPAGGKSRVIWTMALSRVGEAAECSEACGKLLGA